MKKSMSILLVLALVLSICAPLSALAGGGQEREVPVNKGEQGHVIAFYIDDVLQGYYNEAQDELVPEAQAHVFAHVFGEGGKCACGYVAEPEEEECKHHGMSACVKWSTLFGKFVSVDCFYCADCGKFFASVAGGNALDAHMVLVDTYLGDGIKKEEEAETKTEKAIAKVAVGVSNLFDKVGVLVKATTKAVNTVVNVVSGVDLVHVDVEAGDLSAKTTAKASTSTKTKVGLFKLW